MFIFHTRKEILNKLHTTRPAKNIAAFFYTIFPESTPVARRAPLLRNALALFKEHWAAADGAKVQLYAHNAVFLLRCTVAEWRTKILRAEASVTHSSKLQVQVPALEAKLANTTKEVPANQALKASGSSGTLTNDDLHCLRLLWILLEDPHLRQNDLGMTALS